MDIKQLLYNIITKYQLYDVKMLLVDKNNLDRIKRDILNSFLEYLEKEIKNKGYINVKNIKITKRDYGLLYQNENIEEMFM